jgi:hypothetical protein
MLTHPYPNSGPHLSRIQNICADHCLSYRPIRDVNAVKNVSDNIADITPCGLIDARVPLGS